MIESGTKWAYLNGHVGFGDFHHQIVDKLVDRAGVGKPDAQMLSNIVLVNATPHLRGHDIAWGHMQGGYPLFWHTNVQRDPVERAVRDAAQKYTSLSDMDERSQVDPIHFSMVMESLNASGGDLIELKPGDQLIDYDGQPKVLPPEQRKPGMGGTNVSTYYGANVVLDGKTIGSMEVEVENYPDSTREVMIHNAWVDPQYRGSDAWLKLYRWFRSRWPNDRAFGDFANEDVGKFFERDNKRLVGDDSGWESTIPTPEEHVAGWKTSVVMPDNYHPVAPIPERVLQGFAQKMPEAEHLQPIPGGRYFDTSGGPPPMWNDVTGETRQGAQIHAGQLDGPDKPKMFAHSALAEPGDRHQGRVTRVNLFRQRAARGSDLQLWKWHHNPSELQHDMLVSVERGGKHFYTLQANMNGPVTMQTYPNSPSEPRLRPTMYSDEPELGEPVAYISVGGAVKPVYDRVDLAPRVEGEHLGSVFAWHAPWYQDQPEGSVFIGNWGQTHDQIGFIREADFAHGWIDRDGFVERIPRDAIPALERVFWPLPVTASEAPESDSKTTGWSEKGKTFTAHDHDHTPAPSPFDSIADRAVIDWSAVDRLG